MNYLTLNRFLLDKFGGKVLKICVDGGFTCPNRDGKCGTGGCAFCSSEGSGEHILTSLPVSEQISRFKKRLDPKLAKSDFLIYFQNYTNTYAPIDKLRALYTEAISAPGVVALAVATRPDCIDENVAKLLKELSARVYVWVELGLQTASDKTAEYFNRGYRTEVFSTAAEILNSYDIDFVTHLIIGLPNETKDDFKKSIDFVNKHRPAGVKLHSLYIAEGTRFAEMYKNGEFDVQTEDEYIDWVLYAITHIPENVVLHRLMGTCSPDRLIAPEWNGDKNRILIKINDILDQNGWKQGCFYSPPELE